MNPLLASLTQFMNGWAIAALFFCLIFFAFLSGTLRAFQSKRWPTVAGKVIQSGVTEKMASDSSEHTRASITYQPHVRYRYELEGKTLESEQIAIGAVTGSKAYAEKVAGKYPEASAVTVYHHPKLHYLAVLEPGKWVMPLILTLVLLPVCYGMCAVWVNKSLHPKVSPWQHRTQAPAR